MDYAINDREPTITSIKEKITTVKEKIIEYQTLYKKIYNNSPTSESNDSLFITEHNDGSVSCNSYCHGVGGHSTNNELPSEWKGAQCIAAGHSNGISCHTAGPDQDDPRAYHTTSENTTSQGYLYCLCKRNDRFPYNINAELLSDTDVLAPSLYSPANSDIEILNTKRSFIISEINNINSLINRISPRLDENRTKINSNVSKLINTFNVMNVEFDKLETELEKPVELNGHYEISKMKTSANYGNYIMFLLFAIFIIGCLIYIYKNPEGGNLDMFILGLALIILAYYLYEYYVTKIKKI